MYSNILSPLRVGSLELSNRFIMPGMGVNHNGTIDEDSIAWYEARAKGGFGLIITEFCAVESDGKAVPGEVVVDSDDVIPSFSKLTEAVHRYDTKIFMQIHHAGRETNHFITGNQPVSASAVPCPANRELPRALTTEEVYSIIEKFGDAALRAKKAGFDGVELHFGHGYLGTQFLSAYVNRRTDAFGGDLTGRVRFGVEVVQNIKSKCGSDFPVSMRISGEERVVDGRKLDETAIMAKMLEKAGVDIFNVSTGVYASMPYIIAPYTQDILYNIHAAEVVKKAVSVPVIGVGRINDPVVADSVIEDGLCDAVIMGRSSIADPEFPNKVKANKTDEISPCIGCLTRCQGMPASNPNERSVSCAINPFAGHERSMVIEKAQTPKRIVVVGGGVGGLETAWVAASRGHQVTLIEKSSQLGGQCLYACVPPNKYEIARAIKYYITMCHKYGVDIRLNCEATKESILALEPDAVVLATGAVPIASPIPGDEIPVLDALDVLGGRAVPGNRVLVIGGGLVGLETAEFLVSQLRQATIVEMLDTVGDELNRNVKFFVLKFLRENGVEVKTGTKVLSFTADGAVCSTKNGEVTLSGYDTVVIALGAKPYNPLQEQLAGAVPELHVIGDAGGATRSIRASVDAGARLALKL